MKLLQIILLLLLPILLAQTRIAHADVGFRQLQIPDRQTESADSARPDLTIGLWYPTNATAATIPNTPFGHALAVNEPIAATEKLPLVLLSHGYSGWYAGHADTARVLAAAGYLVAAPSHTGNHFADMSSPIEKWTIDRPRHISASIDYLLSQPLTRDVVDADRIGVYGFSAGGHTALSLIGGIPDMQVASRHCKTHKAEFACAEGMIDRLLAAESESGHNVWGYDARIRAAAIAAPGLAFAYTRKGLKNVQVPVQLWSAANDHSVPHDTNAAQLAVQLPQMPDLRLIENANHFAFIIMPCRPAFEKEDPEEYKFVCGDKPGFDRREFHRNMNNELVVFFDQSMTHR